MLSLKDLSLTLGDFSLKDISMEVGSGEYFVILGPSGSGKTVLLETIAGRYQAYGGSINYREKDLGLSPVEERNVGFVYQDYELFPHMTVEENILFGLKFRKLEAGEKEARLKYLARLLKIERIVKAYPKNLSGGEKQRVALARALIIRPDIILLDEPFSSLDVNIKLKLQEEMKLLKKDLKASVVHVTHDLEEAIYLADKLAIMIDGSLKILKNKEDLEKEEYFKDYFLARQRRF